LWCCNANCRTWYWEEGKQGRKRRKNRGMDGKKEKERREVDGSKDRKKNEE
jgi:hypothetical protein